MVDYTEAEIRDGGLHKKLVFVVGNARSGTTIVAQILNLCEGIFILEEGHLYQELGNPEFPRRFNTRHQQEGKRPRKGTYVPRFDGDQETALATLRRLARDYDLVGDKVAFGPYDFCEGQSQQHRFFEQHARFFLKARYILTARNPHESLLSMHRMFPQEDLHNLLWRWLESLRYACISMLWFPRCRFLFLEQLGSETFAALGDFLSISVPVSDQLFGETLRQTSLAAAYDFGRDHQEEIGTQLGACDIIYTELRRYFSPTKLTYKAAEPIFALLDQILQRIEAVQHDLRPAFAAQP